MEISGIRLLGISTESRHQLLLTFAFIAVLLSLRFRSAALVRLVLQGHQNEQVRFWAHQGLRLALTALLLLGALSIWFKDPTRLTTVLGFIAAGPSRSSWRPPSATSSSSARWAIRL